MALATVSRRNRFAATAAAADGAGFTARLSLTARILAVNVFALVVLAGSFFYLDGYRTTLIEGRSAQAADEAAMAADALAAASPAKWPGLMAALGKTGDSRLRLYRDADTPPLDSWKYGPATYTLRDPHEEPWRRKAARFMDRVVDRVVGADTPDLFEEPARDRLEAWPEAVEARRTGQVVGELRSAPERTPVISAAAPVAGGRLGVLLLTSNQRDVVRTVRAERFWLGLVLLGTIILSVLLSVYLARTIARPLRRLARAAHRVRLGRSREVQVPRLPARRDEIGTLARALSDMSQALRHRIDATEAFAADVAHEMKNPLASLRSAVDSLDVVTQPELRERLVGVIRDDVARLDRLITDISEASRLDAELSRARFETVDLGQMIEQLVEAQEMRGVANGVRVAFARPHRSTTTLFGDGSRIARVIQNLVDNAISFSPPDGLVQIAATRDGDTVHLRVEDEGPGVPLAERESIFKRFHSVRPAGEAFGRHSGLGLAIAKAIVEGHGGTIAVADRDEGVPGACFVIRLPAAQR